MTESAGIVNYDAATDDSEFSQLIAAKPAEVRHLARAVRALVLDVLPQTVEVVWPRQGSVGWGTGPRKFTEQFAYLMCFTKHVTLGFYQGGDLPDPEHLLPASGGRQVRGSLSMRSLKLSSVEEVERPALRALVEAATRHRVSPPPT